VHMLTSKSRSFLWLGAPVAALSVAALALAPGVGRADAGVSFSAVYVDRDLGGGEPYVIYSHGSHDLVYTSHEGTTHLDNANPHTGDCDVQTQQGFLCSYDNQVNIWTSTDGGQTWTKRLGNPIYTGFSDPSLSEDEANNIYDTGIDLANDAVYASQDGGVTWVAGTPQCHEGDRPWLAGGKPGEVFMSTDSEQSGHEIVHGTLSGVNGQNLTLVCSTAAITDNGGQGQLYYNHSNGDLIEGADFNDGGYGIGVLPNASNANFSGSGTPTPFTQHESSTLCSAHPTYCSDFAIFAPQIAIDAAGTTYVVWANNPRGTATTGCGGLLPNTTGGPNLLPNQVIMVSTPDEGQTWSEPMVIASPPNGVVTWPWIAAGAAGNISVVWDQSDQVTDPDCDSAALATGGRPTNWTVQVANIYGVNTATPVVDQVDAVPNFDGLHAGGVMHTGGICQSGTTCAATGQDRRLGDFLTNSLDQNGCVMVATGDTQLTDPITGAQFPTSRPLFLEQASGPSLTTGLPCNALVATTPEAPVAPLLIGGGVIVAAGAGYARRRRRTEFAI